MKSLTKVENNKDYKNKSNTFDKHIYNKLIVRLK